MRILFYNASPFHSSHPTLFPIGFALAKEAAIEAGEVIIKFINDQASKKRSNKNMSGTDIVTAFDTKCEDLIVSKITAKYPTHKIIAEESTEDPTKFNITNDPTWLVDPIDGTTNFFHGVIEVAVSIGVRINKIVSSPFSLPLF